MSDDYLWDRSGPPDPDVERLERTLGLLRATPSVPDVSAIRPTVRLTTSVEASAVKKPDTTYVGTRFLAPALAAAAAIAMMVGVTWQTTRSTTSWQVATISGEPRIGSHALAGEGRLAIGQTLTTDATSSARVEVGTIGEVTVGSNTRVRLVETCDTHHRLALERGSLHAVIAAPPGQFIVETPSATATDLGCVYTLRVDEDGSGLLSVGAGWVAFEEKGRESFVPAGASSRMVPASGPGTPSYDDADQMFHDALDAVDLEHDDARRLAALRIVLEHARERDAMTLWHLIPRVPAANRGAVVDALALRVAMPPTITRDAVILLDRTALDQWWDALGLLDTTWWRKWKGSYPAAGPMQSAAASSCPETPMVRATPPPTQNAGTLGDGPWYVNEERSIWMLSATGPWHAGLNQKNMMVKSAGVIVSVSGTRIDASAPPMEVRTVPQRNFEFQTMAITFPSEGCWKITAKGGDRSLEFITRVGPRP